jgi:hypothetical protein
MPAEENVTMKTRVAKFLTFMTILTIVTMATLAVAHNSQAAADPGSRHFTTTMIAHLGDQPARTGDLTITIAADGGVSGTYRNTTAGSDGKSQPVTGGLQGNAIQLTVGQNGDWKIVGTLDQNGIVGSAYDGSRHEYDFIASNA